MIDSEDKTVAGGDGGLATEARLYGPSAVTARVNCSFSILTTTQMRKKTDK